MRTREVPEILIADDHVDMAQLLAAKLDQHGWRTRVADSGRAAIAALTEDPPDLVLTDLRMPGIDGFGVLEATLAKAPDVPVIVMSAFGEIATAVEAMRRGAWHFVVKPVRMSEILAHAQRALAHRAPPPSTRLVGDSAGMAALARRIERVARSSVPVLLRGETGTGKELVARAIHDASDRRDQPFVAVNCTALPESLAESELFGHARGAFTGATDARAGVFVHADGGTLVLDEIGDMPIPLQAKLLRVLQDGDVRAVGAETTRHVDVRVIAATHQDLEARVRSGLFRADLFYRLDVVPIAIPALRERSDDIPALIAHFLELARRRNPHAIVRRLAPEAVAALVRYDWPGNVRELANIVERFAIAGEREELGLEQVRELAPHLVAPRLVALATAPSQDDRFATLREIEDQHIARVLEHCGGNKARAAEVLGVDASTLYRRTKGRAS
jgi:two-component system, NtrC family, response regulator HydG